MPITVRNDVDPGTAHYELGYLQALEAARRQRPYADQAYGTQSAAASNDRIRAQRERMGQLQQERGHVEKEGEGAGFHWKTPIQIHRPGGADAFGKKLADTTETVYRDDGLDPMRTGEWGALGTREE